MAKGILIYAEITKENFIHTVFFELANKANELAVKLGNCPIYAVLIGEKNILENFRESFTKSGIDKVFVFESENIKEYSTKIYSNIIVDLTKEIEPEIILIGATNVGRDLAPRISSALHTGLTADCTDLDINEKGQLAATRPTFGGQLMATILCKTFPQMATVRPKVFKPSNFDIIKNTEFVVNPVDNVAPDVIVQEFMQKMNSTINELDSAEIIVTCGKGMKNQAGFELTKELANTLNGCVAVSRGAIDIGLADNTIQIGQTGKTVSPKVYIACGVSGAIQHVCGILGSDTIIAINKDKNAPIFEVADLGIVGDAFEIIPQLIQKLKNQ